MLNILTIERAGPDVKNYNSIFFENLLSISKTKVHITWVICQPDKLKLQPSRNPNITILDIHDYKNAVEIIQKVKPDLIFVSAGVNIPDFTFALAGKFFDISVVGPIGTQSSLFFSIPRLASVWKDMVIQFFQSSHPTDTDKNQKRFMKAGRFYIYRCLFLLRTQIAAKRSPIQILQDFIILFRIYFRPTNSISEHPRATVTLNLAESEKDAEELVNAGFEKSSIIVTGNPTYDAAFQRLRKFKPDFKKNTKVQVLLLTTNLAGLASKWISKRDSVIKEIVTDISNYKDEISLVVKIHPTGESLLEYQSLINPIDLSIPVYQKGDVIEFLEQADVVISFSASTALVFSLIAKKPIIICNFFDVKNDVFLERGLALECTEISKLVPSIHQILSSNPASSEKVENFIHEFFYRADGLATERVSNAILELIEKKNIKKVNLNRD